jgi:tripartite ATP-independent transporter DctP family solute receptor
MKNKLFSVVSLLVCLMLSAGTVYARETIKIRYAHVAPPVHAQHIAATFFKKYVEAHSDGRIEVSVYPSGQLGGERVLAESIQAGTLDMSGLTSAVLTNFVPEAALLNLPFFFPDKLSYQRLCDSDVGVKIRNAFEKKGFKLLGFKANGYRDFGNNVRPIHTPDDLKTLKIRSIESPLFIDAYKALGNKPVPLPFPEVFSALQQGVVDGIDLHISGIWMAKIPVKYVTVSGWIYSAVLSVINKKRFDSLPPDLQRVVMDGSFEETAVHMGTLAEQEYDAVTGLKKKGVKINVLTPEEKKVFVQKMKPVYAAWREKIGPDLYDEAVKVIQAE